MTNSPKGLSLLRSLLVLTVLFVTYANAFTISSPLLKELTSTVTASSATRCFMAKKKGNNSNKGGKPKVFGEAPVATTKKSSKESEEKFGGPIATKPQAKSEVGMQASPPPSSPVSMRPEQDGMSQGKAALEKLRREKTEQRDAELRQLKQMKDMDKMLQSSPGSAAIPEKVAMRMGKRMLPFVGVPLFGSMGAFVAFWYLSTYKNFEFQPGFVATTTIVLLTTGLLGITYSIISASWDEDEEGSFLGVKEFQKNVASIREGLDRSKQNLLLRERLDGLSEEEFEKAIADLEKREQREQSFQSKSSEELDKYI